MSIQSDFTTINNGINTDIIIIKHNETGFYNITKINKSIYAKKCEDSENEAMRNRIASNPKLIANWFRNQSNKDLINLLQKKLNNDNLYFQLKENAEFKYHGTYVHKFLYDHILMWIDKSYAIEISIILDNIHQSANKKKDETIDKQTCKIDEQTKKIDEMLKITGVIYNQNVELKEEVIETHTKLDEVLEQNDELKEDVDDLNDKVDDLREDKHEKCNDDNDNHFFSLLKTYNLNEYKIVCGLGKHNDKLITKKEDNGVKINKNYTPNACTLRKRFKENDKFELQIKLDEIKNNKKLKNKVNLKREVRKNKKFIIKGSKIILNTGTEEELINKFIELNNERYDEFKNCIV